jgi:surfactin family lipopeptide synthetase C
MGIKQPTPQSVAGDPQGIAQRRDRNRNIEDTYPLSPMQQGMLFHSLADPESGVYVTQVTCTLANLNVPALQQAWRQVMERHPILRSAFVWKNLERPLQVVGRQVGLPLVEEDWRHLSGRRIRYAAFN